MTLNETASSGQGHGHTLAVRAASSKVTNWAAKVCIWCQSNRWNETFKEQSMATIFDWIDSTQSTLHLAFLMYFFSKRSELGKATGAQKDFAHDVFRWNFTPLEAAKGTTEFRQAPGSTNASHTKSWIQFVGSFIQGAVQYAGSLNPRSAATLELLKSYVLSGARSSGVQDLSPLEGLFLGKSPLPPGAFGLKSIDKDGITKLKKKAAEKNVTLAKFKHLYGYK
ncbi:hypothetical protein DL98DRAFT_620991 [Cadophora sp. DSE1049]|nr:hypothetical protein DL98DRAFT_620991 [Cadophora sp. DSE1049]